MKQFLSDPESEIQDNFNSDGEGLSGDFVVSPIGASYNIQGLQAKNNYIIGDGTYFKSTIKSNVTDPEKPIRGETLGLTHMTLTVDQTILLLRRLFHKISNKMKIFNYLVFLNLFYSLGS